MSIRKLSLHTCTADGNVTCSVEDLCIHNAVARNKAQCNEDAA